MKPELPSLADEIAEPSPDMNIKVAAFTVSEKSINKSISRTLNSYVHRRETTEKIEFAFEGSNVSLLVGFEYYLKQSSDTFELDGFTSLDKSFRSRQRPIYWLCF